MSNLQNMQSLLLCNRSRCRLHNTSKGEANGRLYGLVRFSAWTVWYDSLQLRLEVSYL